MKAPDPPLADGELGLRPGRPEDAREVAATGAAELVAPGDAGALAAALARLLGDPARRAELAGAARRVAAPDGPYGWDRIARQTLALYRTLANTR